MNPVPVIVTVVPPALVPDVGEIEVIAGTGAKPNTYPAPWWVLPPIWACGAPATNVAPETATEPPNSSNSAPPVAASFALCVPFAQPPAGLSNTYAAPCPVLAPIAASAAPAMTVLAESATDPPSASPAAPSEAVSFAVCVPFAQPPPGSTNTYAAPCPPFPPIAASGAPATAVPPDTATEAPSSSPAAPSEAVSFAVCVPVDQPPPGSANTYAAPRPPLASTGAPATTVAPDTATE